jgi:HEAT repeats
MDRVQQLIDEVEAAQSDERWKLDTLVDLEHDRDPRVVAFLLRVLSNSSEGNAVRLAVLRSRVLAHEYRDHLATVLVRLANDKSSGDADTRAQVARALGDFTDSDPAVQALGDLALDQSEPFEVRYSAFTSLERVGPTRECIAVLRLLLSDETLGRSARGMLAWWRVD